MTASEQTAAVKSADRVLDVFELLADAGHGLTHAEIGTSLRIPKGSLTKLLKTLVVRGYLTFDEPTRTHTLGPSLAQLSDRPARVQQLIDVSLPVLQALTRSINESSALNRLHGQHTEVIAAATSTQRLVSHLREGDLAPLHAVSGGKAILAQMTDDKLDHYLHTTEFEKVTPHTVTDLPRLRHELEQARSTGIAYSREEYTPGIIGIGTALDLPASFPPCSINVAIPAVRISDTLEARAVRALRDAKRDIETQLREDVRTA
ncbi:IclR family transcriptional regulator [Sinomonas notoginsengisoli]|uniref:IclR family transcriptional regulator n=1 Tax=Sinomonas notoginsengisoli TaxID=1457311 RepID=UPI001F3FD9E9|nr:IclR family transcriptional regulator [Sinomonas notoginsengisoli]